MMISKMYCFASLLVLALLGSCGVNGQGGNLGKLKGPEKKLITKQDKIPIPKPDEKKDKKGNLVKPVRDVCGEGWGKMTYKVVVEATNANANILASMCWAEGCESGISKRGKRNVFIFSECPPLASIKAIIVANDEDNKDVGIGKIQVFLDKKELFTEDCFDESHCGKVRKPKKVNKKTCSPGKDEGVYEFMTLAPDTFVHFDFPSDEPKCGNSKTGVSGTRFLRA